MNSQPILPILNLAENKLNTIVGNILLEQFSLSGETSVSTDFNEQEILEVCLKKKFTENEKLTEMLDGESEQHLRSIIITVDRILIDFYNMFALDDGVVYLTVVQELAALYKKEINDIKKNILQLDVSSTIFFKKLMGNHCEPPPTGGISPTS